MIHKYSINVTASIDLEAWSWCHQKFGKCYREGVETGMFSDTGVWYDTIDKLPEPYLYLYHFQYLDDMVEFKLRWL